jgi:hypothetical protein
MLSRPCSDPRAAFSIVLVEIRSPIICANPGDALLRGRRADYLFGVSSTPEMDLARIS